MCCFWLSCCIALGLNELVNNDIYILMKRHSFGLWCINLSSMVLLIVILHSVCYVLFPGLLSERQCLARNARRKKKIKEERNSSEESNQMVKVIGVDVLDECGQGSGPCRTNIFDKLSEEQQELIRRIVVFQDKYELPSKEEMSKISVCIFNCVNIEYFPQVHCIVLCQLFFVVGHGTANCLI